MHGYVVRVKLQLQHSIKYTTHFAQWSTVRTEQPSHFTVPTIKPIYSQIGLDYVTL
jgi:hypothetical protein